MSLLAFQTDDLTQQMLQLKEGLESPSAMEPLLWCLLVILVGVLIVVWTAHLRKRVCGEILPNDPKRLFHSLIERLELADDQLDVIRNVARDLKLKNPTAMLLAPALFDRCMAEWHARMDGSPEAANVAERIARARRVLFPVDTPR